MQTSDLWVPRVTFGISGCFSSCFGNCNSESVNEILTVGSLLKLSEEKVARDAQV